MKTNLTQHPCSGKCPEFKAEQCNHCLITADLPVLEKQYKFLVGDVVVVNKLTSDDDLLTVTLILDGPHLLHPGAFVTHPDGTPDLFGFPILRHATVAELNAKRRLTQETNV